MREVELVVKISEEIYKRILPYKDVPVISNLANDFPELIHAIANGVSLPKGHGRLKDIDKIEWYGCTTAFDCPHKDRECKDCDRAKCSKTQVDDIPTIIEADEVKE